MSEIIVVRSLVSKTRHQRYGQLTRGQVLKIRKKDFVSGIFERIKSEPKKVQKPAEIKSVKPATNTAQESSAKKAGGK